MENELFHKPIVAVTMGDPAGIGPEICVLSLSEQKVLNEVRPVVIGDLRRLELARTILAGRGRLPDGYPQLHQIENVNEAMFQQGIINVIDLMNVPTELHFGKVDKAGGKASFEYVESAVRLAQASLVDAICTAPIHKEAWRLAGIPFPGHTEAVAAMVGSDRYAMMLVNDSLRVVHVSTHVSLQEAICQVTTENVYRIIELTAQSLKRFGLSTPHIAVAGLNPHAGEGGLFGSEDMEQIYPAVERAKKNGYSVTGPIPADTVFTRGAAGEFAAVIALYHDQGHIAIKMLGIDTGVNVTIGLPILRTSVDHGTAFNIAGQGVARQAGLCAALKATVQLLGNAKV